MKLRVCLLTTLIAPLGALLLGAASETKPAHSAYKPREFTALQKRWWSLQPVVKPPLPSVAAKNGIDAFLLDKLRAKGVTANKPTDRVTLIRRATLDLTGLPPTPEEVQAWVADESPQAWEKLIDRLLASPRYGERWARHWLDVARYADSDGFKADETRPNIWRYRDYVIQSLNEDKPFDRFVKEQIAGDEIYPGDPAALIATGFLRHFPDEYNAANIMQRRQEYLNDITDVTGYAFLGMTVACARCHDHKFDAILHKDYYRLQAFFANVVLKDDVDVSPAALREERERMTPEWDAQTAAVRRQMQEMLVPARESFYQERLSRFPEEIQETITMAPEKRTAYQWHMYLKARAQVTFSDAEVAGRLGKDKQAQYRALEKQLDRFHAIRPPNAHIAQTMGDNGAHSPKTHIMNGGAWDAPLDAVQPGFLTLLNAAEAQVVPALDGQSSGRRAALAKWLVSRENPLTARVFVNRIWAHHFGRGIAGTPNDLGIMGERPTNQPLLDYLAATFVEDGWSIKRLHRRIMLSNVYRQSSEFSAASAKVDPDNKLLWRFDRRRLEGEAVRDSMLHVSGSLSTRMYGPGVFPPLPSGMVTRGGWNRNENAEDKVRSVYIFVRRNTRYPMLEAFDMPDTHESCARRNNTVTPAQALELMNNEVVVDWAKALARRVANDSGLSTEAKVDRAYKLVFSRPATAEEKKLAAEFLEKQERLVSSRTEEPSAGATAFADLCHMLLNSNEFLYIN